MGGSSSTVQQSAKNKQTNGLRHERVLDVTPCPHPGAVTDSRRFRFDLGRTVLSSGGADTGALVEDERRTVGRRPGPSRAGPTATASVGGDARTGAAFHDIPSRSANSVFTPANERRRRAHCA